MKIAYRFGHNPACPGANAIVDEVTEDRKYGARVIELLESAGVECINCTPGNISNSNQDLNYGVDKANAQTTDLFVSFHLNNAYNHYDGAIGSEVWIMPNSTRGNEISNRILNNLANVGFINRGTKESSGLYELRATVATALIIEPFFVEATRDVELYRQNFEGMCRAIAEGILGQSIGNGSNNNGFKPEKNEPYTFTHELIQFTNDDDVNKLKSAMIEIGYVENMHVNDWYDEYLVAAIKDFQAKSRLGVNGNLDQWTVTSINSLVQWIRYVAEEEKRKQQQQQNQPQTPINYEQELCRILVDGINMIALTGKTKCENYAKENYAGHHVKIQCVKNNVVVSEFDVEKPQTETKQDIINKIMELLKKL